MTKQTLTVMALATTVLVLSGCNSSGKSQTSATPKAAEKVTPITITPGQEADLLPVKAGNSWVYEAVSNSQTPQGSRSQTTEVTFKVATVEDTADGKDVTMDVSTDGNVSDRLIWRVSPSGIYQVAGSTMDPKTKELKSVKFEPALKVVPFPVKPGSEETLDLVGVRPGAAPGPFKAVVTTEGIQEVDTVMGRLSALATTQQSDYKENNVQIRATSTAYWTPKIGIVRYYQELVAVNNQGQSIQTVTTLRLKSHNP